ncbi:uncharacterized protein LOC115813965 [Chanos chanos]|uniref:Uncharacterized protein LOC115813965 n=1 Tax=Chanos chanos TaxID=29144 RepID=A0A6J2VKJ0_CHACN|nr:uncharacterized protein LOC115813965 [Chanos chanos]
MVLNKVKSRQDKVLVNGFHAWRPVEVKEEYRHRTSLNKSHAFIELRDLRVKDSGQYCCEILSGTKLKYTRFQLRVTANYSHPTISVECGLGSNHGNIIHGNSYDSCVVTCSASHGFPLADVMWTVSAQLNHTLTENITHIHQDNTTDLWSVFQSVFLNCSQPVNVSCSVGGSASQLLTLCPRTGPPAPDLAQLIACLMVIVGVFGVMVGCGAVRMMQKTLSCNI